MIKKGIILAGGMGTRMSPLTKAVNKQLLPIYDKPLIYYPLSILMLAKIKNILIIVNKGQLEQYKKIIPDGKKLGIKITYLEQDKPRGLPDAFILGEKFINKDNIAMILGDNFFYGQSLTNMLLECVKIKKGAKVILHKVINPQNFGVAAVKNNKIQSIKEKPKKFISDLAITGLYFFDNKVVQYAKKLKPSKRKELEIIDLLNKYKKNKQLSAEFIGRGGAWLDTGTIEDFYKTSNFVSSVENRQGFKIACIEEIAFNNKWIKKTDILESITELEKINIKINSSNLTKSNPSLNLAKEIKNIPLIYYPYGLQSVATRFKNVLQENVKIHAITEDIVEACHNGIVSWERKSDIKPILIQGKDDHIKTKERWKIIKEYFHENKIDYYEIISIEGSILSKLINLIYILDYCSIYKAILSKTDPTPVKSIHYIKSKLN